MLPGSPTRFRCLLGRLASPSSPDELDAMRRRVWRERQDLAMPTRWRLQHGGFSDPIREADPETGLTVVHRRAADTLGVMLSNGAITPAMHDAGQVFRTQFQRVALHGVRIASLLRFLEKLAASQTASFTPRPTNQRNRRSKSIRATNCRSKRIG